MSQENVEIVREFFAASEARDSKAALARLDAEVDWDATRLPAPLPQRHFRGHAGWREFWTEVYAELSDFRYELQEILDAGEHVVAVAGGSAQGRRSGASATFRQFLVYRIRNAQIVYMCAYQDRTEALEAVGLSE